MRLEKVLKHYSNRDDIYLNIIITPHEKISHEERMQINQILLKEVLNRKY